MNTKEAKKYIELHRRPHGNLDEEGIIDLIIWAYDKGWTEGVDDYTKHEKAMNGGKKHEYR